MNEENNVQEVIETTTVTVEEDISILKAVKQKVKKLGKAFKKNWKPFMLGAGAAAGAILLGGIGSKSDGDTNTDAEYEIPNDPVITLIEPDDPELAEIAEIE